MFQTAPGVTIPRPDLLREEYQVYEGCSVVANISFEKLKDFLLEFVRILQEPLFFVMQLPLCLQEEKQMGLGQILHQEVLYLDLQTRAQINAILTAYGDLLLEDGMSQFAVASHPAREEIFIQKYKLTELYSSQPRRFLPLLHRYGLTETEQLTTAWNTFSKETPGECRLVTRDGMTCYDVADRLKERGMYRAKVIDQDGKVLNS